MLLSISKLRENFDNRVASQKIKLLITYKCSKKSWMHILVWNQPMCDIDYRVVLQLNVCDSLLSISLREGVNQYKDCNGWKYGCSLV